MVAALLHQAQAGEAVEATEHEGLLQRELLSPPDAQARTELDGADEPRVREVQVDALPVTERDRLQVHRGLARVGPEVAHHVPRTHGAVPRGQRLSPDTVVGAKLVGPARFERRAHAEHEVQLVGVHRGQFALTLEQSHVLGGDLDRATHGEVATSDPCASTRGEREIGAIRTCRQECGPFEIASKEVPVHGAQPEAARHGMVERHAESDGAVRRRVELHIEVGARAVTRGIEPEPAVALVGGEARDPVGHARRCERRVRHEAERAEDGVAVAHARGGDAGEADRSG